VNHQIGSKKKPLNKKACFIGITILILILIIGGILLRIKSTKKQDSKNSTQQQEEQKEKSKIDSYMLISSLNITGLPSNYFGYFFQKQGYSKEEIDNQIKIYMAIQKIISEKKETYKDVSKTLHIDEEEIKSAVIDIFGQDSQFKNESLIGNSCSYSGFQYDKKKKQYIQEPGECAEDETMSILMEQVGIENTEEEQNLTVRIAFVDFNYHMEEQQIEYLYYKDKDKTTLIGTSNQYSLEEFREQLDQYKFTWINKNEQYIFDKVVRVQN